MYPPDYLRKAVRVCAQDSFPESPARFRSAARAVYNFCWLLSRGFGAVGAHPLVARSMGAEAFGGDFALAIDAFRCARVARRALAPMAERTPRDRRRDLRAACRDVKSITATYDAKRLVDRMVRGLQAHL